MVNISGIEKTIDDYFDELRPDVKGVKFYEGKIEIDVVKAVPAVDFTATEWDDFLALFVYKTHLITLPDQLLNKCWIISPEGEPTFSLEQDDLGVTILELNQHSRNRALLRQFGEAIQKTPYEFLFPYDDVREEVVQELNGWGQEQRKKYLDIMVMQEVQRREGVDFMDFWCFWLKKGRQLKETVQEINSRNPTFFVRGSKEYFGPLKWAYRINKGYFISDVGKAYLTGFEERTREIQEQMEKANSVRECREILEGAGLTPAEYLIQRGLFIENLFKGKNPQIFREEKLGGCILDLMAHEFYTNQFLTSLSQNFVTQKSFWP